MEEQVSVDPSPIENLVDTRSALNRNVKPAADAVVARCRGPAVVNQTGKPTANIFHSLLFGSGPKIGLAGGSWRRTTRERATAATSRDGVTAPLGVGGHNSHPSPLIVKDEP